MKQFIFKTFASFLLLLLICSCGIKSSGIPDDKKDYIGVWQSEEIYLNIQASGQVDYKRKSGGSTTSVNAPIQQFKGNNFIVGALGFNTTFVVSKVPHQENGIWKMTVDRRELIKQ